MQENGSLENQTKSSLVDVWHKSLALFIDDVFYQEGVNITFSEEDLLLELYVLQLPRTHEPVQSGPGNPQ